MPSTANAMTYPRSCGTAPSATPATMIVDTITLPIEPPIVRTLAFMPVATPVCVAGTASTTRFDIAENAKPMPRPTRPIAR